MQTKTLSRAFARLAFAVAVTSAVGAALAVDSVKMMIPAAPGGGWDSTGRALGAALQASGAVQSIQYDNKGGAAGAIGLAQFVNTAKGDASAMMVGGISDRSRILPRIIRPRACSSSSCSSQPASPLSSASSSRARSGSVLVAR